MKKMFLDNLPMKNGVGANKDKLVIDWKSSVGMKVNFIYDNIEGFIEIVDYEKEKLILKYNGMVFDKGIATCHFSNCGIGYYLGVKTNEFKYGIGDNIDDITIIETEVRNRKKKSGATERCKWYKYHCNKCTNEDWVEENHLKEGKHCNACCNPPKKVVLGINTIYDKSPWMIDLGMSEEDAKTHTPQGSDKIVVVCPDCGKKKNIIIRNMYNRKSISCSCGDGRSYISKYLRSVLEQLNIKHKTEVKYEWNKYVNPLTNKESQASIDFVMYYNDREIPLEADGAFHRNDNNMNGMTAEMHIIIDSQRDENCLKHLGEETIRISDECDIRENILNSKLNTLFDLSSVNWLKCEEFALSNLVKGVCKYWNEKGKDETVLDLIRIFDISRNALIGYLKKGTKLGWCDYNPKEELIKRNKRNGAKSGKAVKVFRGGICLGVFESAIQLENVSEDIFGDKLLRSNISMVCNGKCNHHKGYTFKFAQKEEYEEYLNSQHLKKVV